MHAFGRSLCPATNRSLNINLFENKFVKGEIASYTS